MMANSLTNHPSHPILAPLAIDVAEAARLAAVSASTIRRSIASGGLKVVRLGRTVRIRPADLDAWLVANTAGCGNG